MYCGDDMEINNPKYKKQGIHVMAAVFTVDHGITKILLVERKNEPFYGMWSLPGGALYNDEDLEDGMKRELLEKTGLVIPNLKQCSVFGKVHRSPCMRMIGISYFGVIDRFKVELLTSTLKTSNAGWFAINQIPPLAYDHEEIIQDALEKLKESIVESDILEILFPKEFTLPEIQKVYESILGITYDRRNFRKRMLSLELIEDTGETAKFGGKKPAKLYRFRKEKKKKRIF